MKSASMTTPGRRSATASSFSLSSSRTSRDTRTRSTENAATAAPSPWMTLSFKTRRSEVDLAELAGRPLHRFLRLHLAAAGLGVHHRDDELVPGLGGPLVGLAGVAHQPLLRPRRRLEGQHDRILVRHRVVLPLARRPDREAFLHGEPLLVVFLLVRPAQELHRALGVLRVLHHHVVERAMVGMR